MNLQTQENLQTELKSRRICRFCMTQKEPLTNIYSKENRVNSAAPLPLQVMACVSIEVFTNDGMPNTICETCRLLMEHCYRFKQMCKKADTTLRQYPLTGTWPEALDVPKIPEGLLKQYDLKKKKTILNTHSAVLDEEEPKYEIIKPPPSPVTPTSRPKLLNKSTMKILNKNANIMHEPVLSKPVIKRNDAGQVEIVTEILDDVTRLEDPDPISTAQPIETNVFPCPHCERSFPLRQLLDIHMVNHNRERSFVCEICDKRFFSKYDLGKHMLIHTGEKPFQCVVCNKSFTRSTLLHRHEKIHTDQPKFLCVFCEKPFLSKDELEKHTDRHKKNRPFPCKICGKCFAFKQGLERHETVHARDQPFPCQYCDQSFSTPSKLSRHLTAHAGERPFPCKLCPKSYLLSHHLTRHLRSHTQGSGSYKCYDCERMFTTRDDLIYHSAVHATQTLVCPLCKEQFENLDQVTEHIKQHAEGEQYACEFCDLIFMTADKLQAHSDVDHVEDLAAYEEHTKNNIIDVKREVHISYDSSQDGQPDEEVLQEFIIEEYHEAQAANQGASTSRFVKQEKELIIERDRSPAKRNANKVKPPPQKILNKQAETTRRSRENNKPASQPPVQQPDEESNDFDDMEVETLENREAEAEVDDDDEDYELGEEEEDEIYEPPKKVVKAIQKKSPMISKSVTLERITRTVKTPIKLESVAEKRKLPERKDSVTLTKLKQPTINSVLQQLPKSVTVIKKEKPAVVAVTNVRKPESAKEIRVLNERILRKPTSKESVQKEAPTMLDVKTPVKVVERKGNTSVVKAPRVSPVASTSKPAEQDKQKSKLSPQNAQPQKKLVEMMIDNRKVKVQKIMMTKAEVAAMAKEGKIEMKGGTMILKQESKPSGKMIARPSTSKSS